MQVTALAQALDDIRRADGVFSLQELQSRLSRAGLEELARAVASLARRAETRRQGDLDPDKRPWA